MEKPKYIAVVSKYTGKRLSHMKLNEKDKCYDTYGWYLPFEYISYNEQCECYQIKNHMDHLTDCLLEPISESVFRKGKWGVESKVGNV